MEHSLLPWELDPEVYRQGYDHTIPHYRILGVIGGKAGRTIADVGGWTDRLEAKADASFIVHACNAHEELLEACIYAIGCIDGEIRDYRDELPKKLRRAIAKATSLQAR